MKLEEWDVKTGFSTFLDVCAKKATQTKLQSLAAIAVDHEKLYYKHVTSLIEKKLDKDDKITTYLNLLYVVSEILRFSKKQLGTKDKYAERMQPLLVKITQKLGVASQEYQDKLRKILKLLLSESVLTAAKASELEKVLGSDIQNGAVPNLRAKLKLGAKLNQTAKTPSVPQPQLSTPHKPSSKSEGKHAPTPLSTSNKISSAKLEAISSLGKRGVQEPTAQPIQGNAPNSKRPAIEPHNVNQLKNPPLPPQPPVEEYDIFSALSYQDNAGPPGGQAPSGSNNTTLISALHQGQNKQNSKAPEMQRPPGNQQNQGFEQQRGPDLPFDHAQQGGQDPSYQQRGPGPMYPGSHPQEPNPPPLPPNFLRGPEGPYPPPYGMNEVPFHGQYYNGPEQQYHGFEPVNNNYPNPHMHHRGPDMQYQGFPPVGNQMGFQGYPGSPPRGEYPPHYWGAQMGGMGDPYVNHHAYHEEPAFYGQHVHPNPQHFQPWQQQQQQQQFHQQQQQQMAPMFSNPMPYDRQDIELEAGGHFFPTETLPPAPTLPPLPSGPRPQQISGAQTTLPPPPPASLLASILPTSPSRAQPPSGKGRRGPKKRRWDTNVDEEMDIDDSALIPPPPPPPPEPPLPQDPPLPKIVDGVSSATKDTKDEAMKVESITGGLAVERGSAIFGLVKATMKDTEPAGPDDDLGIAVKPDSGEGKEGVEIGKGMEDMELSGGDRVQDKIDFNFNSNPDVPQMAEKPATGGEGKGAFPHSAFNSRDHCVADEQLDFPLIPESAAVISDDQTKATNLYLEEGTELTVSSLAENAEVTEVSERTLTTRFAVRSPLNAPTPPELSPSHEDLYQGMEDRGSAPTAVPEVRSSQDPLPAADLTVDLKEDPLADYPKLPSGGFGGSSPGLKGEFFVSPAVSEEDHEQS